MVPAAVEVIILDIWREHLLELSHNHKEPRTLAETTHDVFLITLGGIQSLGIGLHSFLKSLDETYESRPLVRSFCLLSQMARNVSPNVGDASRFYATTMRFLLSSHTNTMVVVEEGYALGLDAALEVVHAIFNRLAARASLTALIGEVEGIAKDFSETEVLQHSQDGAARKLVPFQKGVNLGELLALMLDRFLAEQEQRMVQCVQLFSHTVFDGELSIIDFRQRLSQISSMLSDEEVSMMCGEICRLSWGDRVRAQMFVEVLSNHGLCSPIRDIPVHIANVPILSDAEARKRRVEARAAMTLHLAEVVQDNAALTEKKIDIQPISSAALELEQAVVYEELEHDPRRAVEACTNLAETMRQTISLSAQVGT